jgi:hypothetical protein
MPIVMPQQRLCNRTTGAWTYCEVIRNRFEGASELSFLELKLYMVRSSPRTAIFNPPSPFPSLLHVEQPVVPRRVDWIYEERVCYRRSLATHPLHSPTAGPWPLCHLETPFPESGSRLVGGGFEGYLWQTKGLLFGSLLQ